MSNWKRLGRDCPICSGQRKHKDCRQSLSSGLVFCHDDTANPTGWIFRKHDSNGFGIWQDEAEATAYNEQSQIDRDRERAARQAQKQARREAAVAAQLSASDRDRWNRKLQAHLTLQDIDRTNLLDRGFLPEWIEADGYRTVEQWQEIPSYFPINFPGRTQRGNLAVTMPGYLCPIPNVEGQTVGFQTRRRDGSQGRYGWLSAEAASVHLNGEMPIGVYEPQQRQGDAIWLVDSPAIKASLTRYRLSVPTIGATNGCFSASEQTTIHTLAVLADRYNTQKLVLALDAGDVRNKPVCQQKLKQVEFLTGLGYRVRFAWWGQISKQECDIDELDPAQYKTIRMLSLREFQAIAIEQGGLEAETTTSEPDEPRSGVAWDLWRQSRQFTADQSSSQPFFTAPVPAANSAMGIRSGTGTGKTQWLIRTVIQSLGDQGFLSIGYRNSLLIQFAQQVGLLDQGNWYHLQQDLKGSPDLQLLRDPHSKILCCIDSLSYFNPKDFEGKVVILDEVESIVNQLLKSDTAVSFQREKIKDLFGEMLRRCDRVIVLDGHLRDATIDYLRSLAGDSKQFTRYCNGYQGNKGKVEFLEGVESARGLRINDRSPLLQAILNHQGCFVVGSDSQEELQALECKLVEAGRKTLRFDGSTANKTWAKEFLQDPAAYIREHEVEVLLYSPSAEAGLSIDLKGYFNDAYFIFFGVVTTNAQLQMLARVRDPQMQIHIVCPMQGLPSESISKSAIPEVLAHEIKQYVIDCATASHTGLAIEDVVLNLAQKLVQISTDTHFNHEMFLSAIENHERVNLQDCLREALVESGYQVKSVIGQPSTSIEVIQAKRNEVRREKAELTVNATDITTAEADQKSRSFEATEEDKYAVSRRRLLDRLPGIEAATYLALIVQPKPEAQAEPTIQMVEKPMFDATFVQKVRFDNRRLISQIELRWLIEHPEAAQALQQIRWHKRLSIFTDPNEPDSSKRIRLSTYHSRWLKIYKLLELGIDFFLQPGATWHAQTPEAIAFWRAAKHPRNARAIGRRVGRSSTCTYIGEMIRSLGLKTESTYCHTLKIHIYQVDPQSLADPIISAIYNSVEQRFAEILTSDCALDWEQVTQAFERLQSQPQQDVEARSPSANFVIENQEGDHASLEIKASATYTIEAIEYGTETVAAIFQSWHSSFKAAVVQWLETHANTALNQLIELYPDIGNWHSSRHDLDHST